MVILEDHIFSFKLIGKVNGNREVCLAFLYFQKTFDSVPRGTIVVWERGELVEIFYHFFDSQQCKPHFKKLI